MNRIRTIIALAFSALLISTAAPATGFANPKPVRVKPIVLKAVPVGAGQFAVVVDPNDGYEQTGTIHCNDQGCWSFARETPKPSRRQPIVASTGGGSSGPRFLEPVR